MWNFCSSGLTFTVRVKRGVLWNILSLKYRQDSYWIWFQKSTIWNQMYLNLRLIVNRGWKHNNSAPSKNLFPKLWTWCGRVLTRIRSKKRICVGPTDTGLQSTSLLKGQWWGLSLLQSASQMREHTRQLQLHLSTGLVWFALWISAYSMADEISPNVVDWKCDGETGLLFESNRNYRIG